MKLLSLVFSLFLALIVTAQNKPVINSLDEGTIEQQYDYLWESSNRYQDHRVIKTVMLKKFKDNVSDSVTEFKTSILDFESQHKIDDQNLSILQDNIEELAQQNDSVLKLKDQFQIAGISTNKSSFKTIFWVLLGALLTIIAILFTRLKAKTAVTKDTRLKHKNLESEYEDFKKRAREKEQILARQLQDELNKKL